MSFRGVTLGSKRAISPRMTVRLATAFVLTLPMLACKREPAPTFGEPIGVQLAVGGTNVQLAIASSSGSSVTSSVNTIASGFFGALTACPDAIALLKTGKGMRIQFSVVDGKVVKPDNLPSEAPVACVLSALHGKTLFVANGAGGGDAAASTAPVTPVGKFAVLAEVRQSP